MERGHSLEGGKDLFAVCSQFDPHSEFISAALILTAEWKQSVVLKRCISTSDPTASMAGENL